MNIVLQGFEEPLASMIRVSAEARGHRVVEPQSREPAALAIVRFAAASDASQVVKMKKNPQVGLVLALHPGRGSIGLTSAAFRAGAYDILPYPYSARAAAALIARLEEEIGINQR